MKHIKFLLACLLMTVFGIGQVWAGEVSITPSQALNDGGVSPIATSCAKGDGTSNPAISSGELRLYQAGSGKTTGNTISFSSTYSITKIVFDFTSGKTASNGSFSEGSYDDATMTWTGSATSLTLTVTGTTSGTRIYIKGMTVTYDDGGGTQTCATPSFSPAAGSYEGTQNVTISSTAGATIYYTTDGTTPSTTSNVYSSPIAVSADMTIKAYAVKAEYDDSEVAEATYTITEGPDVTLDLIDGNWGFPTSGGTSLTEYTNSETGYSVSCYAANEYKVSGSNYFFIGKKDSYILLPEFSNPIAKIVVVGNSGGSSSTKFNIFDGETAVSTEVTSCAVDQTFEITNPEANKHYTLKVTSAHNLQLKKIKIYYGAAAAVNKPSISGDEEFISSTSVSMSCSTTGAAIYYTTNGADPKDGGANLYENPIPLSEGASFNARAKLGDDWSGMVSKTFTKVTAVSTMAEVQAAATTTTDQPVNVVISNWVVTAANSSQAWITDADNAKGILLYKSGHGFTAGKKLNGEVVGTKVKLFNLYPELTSLVASDVTVTDAEVISPRATTIPTLLSGHPAEQGTIVKMENVTYSSSTSMLSDGVNSIAADNKFYGSLALIDGTTYDITGVVTYYKDGDDPVVKIAPRNSDDVEAKSAVVIPTAANLAALKAAARGTYILTLTNAVISYVNGKNAFIEDATGGALIFFQDHGFTAGDCLNGDYQVTTIDYQGKFEITAIEPQAGAATTTAEIPLTTVSIATLNANFGSYESMRVKIVGANVTDAISGSDRNGAINDGAALAVYAAVASTITLTADDNVDIIGYPGFHNTDQQLTVWQQSDITVNEKDPAGIAFTPESETITGGDPWSAPTFSNPNSLTVTFSGDNDAVATVNTTTGEIALTGGYGTAIITAHTDGDATHASATVTYTITVNDPGATPVYTMSFDMTRASYDDAADAQVVWNSNVVTMTADKNDGTKVTNYLAGNYSGTTLIAETRLYAKNSISFVPQSGVTITKIEWMSTAKGYATKLAAETFVNATAVVDGTDDKLVIITPSAAGEISVTLTDAARATNVKVYYEAESEKAKLDASIAIADINTAVGEDDIVLLNIAATSNPNKKAISYAITSGTAVSIIGEGKDAAIHALAEGTATITATIPNDFGNYTGATTTFDIIVAAAPATLESIAISGTASVLEYTEGQDFNPAGLVVTGHYSDGNDAVISDGITWAFDPSPLTEGTTSVSVTATVSEISSSAFVVNDLSVSAAPTPEVKNVVILATYNTKVYAMTNSLSSGALAAVEVEKDGSNIVVASAEDKVAIQWTATESAGNTTLMDGNAKYIKGSDGASLSLDNAAYNWIWDGEKSCYISSAYTTRGLFYNNSGVFKGYATSNLTNPAYAAIEVMEIAAENIVVTSKVSAELAYNPASDEITQGDAWSAPELVNPHSVTITSYASDNESVATVEGGVIALAGGIGTAHITAHFDGDASYLEGDAVYTIIVNAPAPTPSGTTYRKVTATENITDGEYLIVYETTNVAFNGALETLDAEGNSVAVTINEGVIAGTTAIDAAVFTIDVTAGTLRSASGKYIGVSSNSNGLKQTEDASTYTHTFSIDGEENAVILANFEGSTMKLRYNPSTTSGNLRFRYYKNDGQQAIQLYKKEAAPEPEYETVRTGLTAGHYYTICYPKAMTDVQGATLWSFIGKDANYAYIEQETATTIEAGKPYIMYATASTVTAVLGDETNAPGANGAIHGTFSNLTQDQLNTYATVAGSDLYLVIGDELRRVTGPSTGGNSLSAQRAFVVVNDIPDDTPAPMPGRQVRSMAMPKNTPTGVENVQGDKVQGTKVLIDGNLYILRGEKMYDATGRLVK